MLGEIGQKLGFVVVDYGGSDRLITFSLQDASAAEVLEQLLRGENYAVVYEGQRKEIAKVLLLTSAMQASTENRQTEKGYERIVQSQGGLTYHSSVSPPSLFVEQKRADKAEPEVRVGDIMRAPALSGMIDPMGSLSGTANVAQPFGSPAGNSFSTGTMSTSSRPQDIHESLATTTLAQQNLKALVDGLANSLFQSSPNGGRRELAPLPSGDISLVFGRQPCYQSGQIPFVSQLRRDFSRLNAFSANGLLPSFALIERCLI